MCHNGIVALGFGIGRSAAFGVIVYLFSNALVKGVLFLTCGNIKARYRTKKIADLPAASVVKRLRDKAFARSVDRSYVYGGAEALGVPLEEHIGFLIEALKPIAEEIGL
jgi:predicted hydrolase (HD superfamily)